VYARSSSSSSGGQQRGQTRYGAGGDRLVVLGHDDMASGAAGHVWGAAPGRR